MGVTVTGLDHGASPMDLRERLHFDADALPAALPRLRRQLGGAGVVILSTCNRVEVYTHGACAPARTHRAVAAFLAAWGEAPAQALADCLYRHTGRAAVRHLFRVSASLESLVVGEAQILGQVQAAFRAARDARTTDKILNVLFEKAFSAAKAVRGTSGIGRGKVSVGSVAVDLAASIFGDLGGRSVLVIGSGKMSELALTHLAKHGPGRITIANRSIEKAEQFAHRFGGIAVSFDRLEDALAEADIVISSTASPRRILGVEAFREALRRRAQAPIFALDIAVPRDIDPAVAALDNVYLHHVDTLARIAAEHLAARREEITRCETLVEQRVERFWKWMQGLAAEPTIVSLSEELNALREQELRKTLEAMPHLSAREREEIAYLTQRVVNRILQRPMRQLKCEVAEQPPQQVLPLVNRLFGLGESSA